MKFYFQVQNEALNYKVSGLEILRGKENVTTGIYSHCRNYITGPATPNINPITNIDGSPVFKITNPIDWLSVTKKISRNASAPAGDRFARCYIQIGNDIANRVVINGAFERIVTFPDGGAYHEIHGRLNGILPNLNNDHATLADILKQRVRHPADAYAAPYSNYSQFLNCLLVLVCIVEPSRHYAMLAYVPMLFDLISRTTHFPPGKRFDWNNVFYSRKGYRWDDYESNGYGGKYPGATHSTGAGNYTDAGKILGKKDDKTISQDIFLKHQHQMTIIRGTTFIIYWLNLFRTQRFQENMANKNEFRLFIDQLIMTHTDYLFKGITTLPRNMRFAHRGTNQVLAANPEPVNFDLQEPCYFFKHKTTSLAGHPLNEHNGEYFHRTNYACKLVPEYVRSFTKKEIKVNNIKRLTTSGAEMQTIEEAQEAGLTACPCCYSPTNFTRVSRPILVAYKEDEPNYHKTVSANPPCYASFWADDVELAFRKKSKLKHCETCWSDFPEVMPPEDRITMRLPLP